jgi:NitT/TauT family transport system permease protein
VIQPAAGRRLPRWAISAIAMLLFLLAWEFFGRRINPIFGSYPTAIARAFVVLAQSGKLAKALVQSLEPFLAGYALAVVIGIPLGLVVGRFRAVEAAIGFFITAGYAMPLVALVPLLVLWFGLGFTVKMAVIFLMAVFPIVINTWLGVRTVPKTLIEVGTAFVAPKAVIVRRIILPATLPYIMAGLKLAVGRGVVGMIIAEFFTSISGLGAIIITSANNFDTATMFVPVLIVMILAWALTQAIGALERRVAPWQLELSGREES